MESTQQQPPSAPGAPLGITATQHVPTPMQNLRQQQFQVPLPVLQQLQAQHLEQLVQGLNLRQEANGPALRRNHSIADSAASMGPDFDQDPLMARFMNAPRGNRPAQALQQLPPDLRQSMRGAPVQPTAERPLLRRKVAHELASLKVEQRHLLLEKLHAEPDFACLFSYDQVTGGSGVTPDGSTMTTAEHLSILTRLVQALDSTDPAPPAPAQAAAAPDSAVEGPDAEPVQAAEVIQAGEAGPAASQPPSTALPGAASESGLSSAAVAPRESLSVTYEPEFDVYSAADGTAQVVLSLRAAAQTDQQQGNIAVTSVLDVSGSMAGRRLDLVKETSHFLVQQVTSQDLLSFVTYSDSPKVDVPMMYMTPVAKCFAHTVLECLVPEGGTALYAGAVAGMQQQMEPIPNDGKLAKALFLCTDGEANVGPMNSDAILPELHKQQSSRGQACTIHTFGIGDGHCAELLQAISESMSGTYCYISSISDVAPAYGDALGGLLSVMAKDVRVTVVVPDTAPGIQLLDMMAGGTVAGHSVTYNDIYAEETRELLLRFKLPQAVEAGAAAAAPAAAQKLLLAEVRVQFVDPATGAQVNIQLPISIPRPAQLQGAAAGPAADRVPRPLVQTTAARYATVDIIKQAQQLGQMGRVSDATKMLKQHASALASASCGSAPGGEAARQLEMLSSQAAVVARVMEEAERNKQDSGSRQRASSTVNAAYHGLQVQRAVNVGATSCLPQAQYSDNMSRQTYRKASMSSAMPTAGRPLNAPPTAARPFFSPSTAGLSAGTFLKSVFGAGAAAGTNLTADPRAGIRAISPPTPPPPPALAGAPFSFNAAPPLSFAPSAGPGPGPLADAPPSATHPSAGAGPGSIPMDLDP